MFAWCSQLLKFKKKKEKGKSALLILKLYPETESVESYLKESKFFFYLKARKEGKKEGSERGRREGGKEKEKERERQREGEKHT